MAYDTGRGSGTDPTLFPQEPKVPRDSDYVIYDETNPTSVINLVWKDFAALLRTFTPEMMQQYFYRGERELRKIVKPEMQLQLLRMRFWQEYDLAQVHGRKIKKLDLLRGICSMDAWENHVGKDPASIAYMLTPPPRYLTRLEAMMNIGIDELGDILTLPNKKEDGTLDKNLMALKVKIWELMDEKVRGATVQRLAIHQKVETTHLPPDPTDLNDLDARLKAVQSQILKSQNKDLFLPTPMPAGISIEPREVIELEGVYGETNLEKAEATEEAASDLRSVRLSEARSGTTEEEAGSGREEEGKADD